MKFYWTSFHLLVFCLSLKCYSDIESERFQYSQLRSAVWTKIKIISMFVSSLLNLAKRPYKQLKTFASNIFRNISHCRSSKYTYGTVPRSSAPLGNYLDAPGTESKAKVAYKKSTFVIDDYFIQLFSSEEHQWRIIPHRNASTYCSHNICL